MEDLHTKLDRILALLTKPKSKRPTNPPPNYLQQWYDAKEKTGTSQYTLPQLKEELGLPITDAKLGRDLRKMPFVSVKRNQHRMVYSIVFKTKSV